MSRLFSTIAALTLTGLLTAAPAPPQAAFTPIDLQPYANQKLNEPLHGNLKGNDLAELPTGKQTFVKIPFTVGKGLVQLGSNLVMDKPDKVEKIKIGLKATKLHFVHSSGHSGSTPADTAVGKYVVHYDDDTTAEIEIVHGKDVVDWWVQDGQKDPTRSKIAWEGTNDAVKDGTTKIKLSLTTWENPHPRKQIVTIDYFNSPEGRGTGAAPFCVAITAEN